MPLRAQKRVQLIIADDVAGSKNGIVAQQKLGRSAMSACDMKGR